MNMKKLILIAILLLPCLAFGQGPNVFVTNSASKPIPVTGISSASAVGATNLNNAQVAASTTAGTLAIARATRVSCLVKNSDAAITIYVGKATVTAANGMPLKPGESFVFTFTGLIQVIAASGTPTVAIFDEY